jgi:putative SOS response-associated peptidase YedK
MCYDAVSATRKLLKYAMHRGESQQVIDNILKRLQELELEKLRAHHHVSGFEHPGLLVFTNDKPLEPQVFTWGLIPSWVKDNATARTLMKQTLNARGETIFEKPAFKFAAKNRRCVIYLDAFYEHHHFKGSAYPFRIAMKDDSPLIVGGLWEEWADRETGEIINTVTVVTTAGNPLMAKIHNNPKLEGPRMPFILSKEEQDKWLAPCKNEEDKQALQSLLKPFPAEELTAHTVKKLKGKLATGNVPEAQQPYVYHELPADLATG